MKATKTAKIHPIFNAVGEVDGRVMVAGETEAEALRHALSRVLYNAEMILEHQPGNVLAEQIEAIASQALDD